MFTATMFATVLVFFALYCQAAARPPGTAPAARTARRAARDQPPFDQGLTERPFRTGGRS